MKKYKTKNDYILSNYLKDKLIKNQKIKTINQICLETSVSIATISRFAKRNGFYDFADMKKNLNTSIKINSEENTFKKFLNGIVFNKDKYSELLIVSSSFTSTIGLLIYQRLKEAKLNVKLFIGQEPFVPTKNCKIIFTSVSGHFSQYEMYMKRKIKNFILISFFNSYNIKPQNVWLLQGNIASDRVDEFNLVNHMYQEVNALINEIFIKIINQSN